MSTPITWRNVTGPSVAEASRPMEAARLALTAGFDRVGKSLQDYEASEAKVFDQQDNLRVQTFLDRLQQVKTPDEIAQLQASGELDTLKQGMSAKSLGLTRGADEARLGSLMTGIEKARTFNKNELVAAEAPLQEQYKALLANGSFGEAKQFLQANPGLSNRSELIGLGSSTELDWTKKKAAEALRPGQEQLALLAQKNSLFAETQKADNAPTEAALAKQKLADETSAVNGKKEDAVILRLAAEQKQARETSLLADRTQLGQVAKQLNLPLDASGGPAVSQMTDIQLDTLNRTAKSNGYKTTTELYEGDTQAAASFKDFISKQPGVSVVGLERNLPAILQSANSTGLNTPLGSDARNIAVNQAQADVALDENLARNPYVPGGANAAAVFEAVRTMLPSIIPEDAKEDIPDIVKLLNELTTVGLELPGGQKITPSKQDIISAITARSGDWNVLERERSKDIKADLLKLMDTPRIGELVAQAQNVEKQQRARAVRNILDSKK